MEALKAATSTAAKRLRIPDGGSVIAGNRADIVLLEADPLADIANIRKLRLVIAGGIHYKPDSLLAAASVSTKP
jgi:imidazolonepropionase-like amidohydrolase